MLRHVHHALSAMVVGCLVLLGPAAAAKAQAPKAADAMKLAIPKAEVTDRDDDETRLLKERYNAALEEWESLSALVDIGQITTADSELLSCLRRVVTAGMELYRGGADRLKLLEEYVRVAKVSADATEAAAAAGRASSHERQRVRYYRLDAELALLREKKRTL